MFVKEVLRASFYFWTSDLEKTLFNDTTGSLKIEDLQSSSCLNITFLSHKQKRPDPVVPLKRPVLSGVPTSEQREKKQSSTKRWNGHLVLLMTEKELLSHTESSQHPD